MAPEDWGLLADKLLQRRIQKTADEIGLSKSSKTIVHDKFDTPQQFSDNSSQEETVRKAPGRTRAQEHRGLEIH